MSSRRKGFAQTESSLKNPNGSEGELSEEHLFKDTYRKNNRAGKR